jgi:hypothetical protein
MEHKKPYDNENKKPWCCEISCKEDAVFEVRLLNGGLEDYTHVCNSHVGFGIDYVSCYQNRIVVISRIER